MIVALHKWVLINLLTDWQFTY